MSSLYLIDFVQTHLFETVGETLAYCTHMQIAQTYTQTKICKRVHPKIYLN